VRWLHSVYGCCHLDLCADNVILQNADFETQRDGSLSVSRHIEVKLIDFGVAQLFARSDFSCFKSQLNIDNGAYVAPEVFDGAVYDARKADLWALGILMFRLVTNAAPFLAEDIWDSERNGYAALKDGVFSKWLRANDSVPLLRKSKNAISLIVSLLQFDAEQRPLASHAVQAKWFSAYWKANGAKLASKMKEDSARLRAQNIKKGGK